MDNFHIGVDARSLSIPITGIGQYTYQLLKILPTLGCRWTFYSHKPLTVHFPSFKNVHIVTGPASNRLTQAVWYQTVLPFLLRKDDLNLFWSPCHHLPVLANRKLPMVVTIHDIVYKILSQTSRKGTLFLESFLMPYAVKRAKKIIAVSQTTKKDLIHHLHVPPDKIQVIYPGVTAQGSVSLDREALKAHSIHKPYILFLGTLEPRKNILRLIQAYSALSTELRQQYQLVLAGGKGWGKENPEQLIQQLNLKEYVIITGYVSEALRCTLLNHASLFAMPSLYEGFGSPVVEAMAAGIPVLTSAEGATAEITKDAACLVNPRDIQAIKSALEKCLIDQAYRKNLIKKGLTCAQAFDWEVAAKQTFNVFTTLNPLLES